MITKFGGSKDTWVIELSVYVTHIILPQENNHSQHFFWTKNFETYHKPESDTWTNIYAYYEFQNPINIDIDEAKNSKDAGNPKNQAWNNRDTTLTLTKKNLCSFLNRPMPPGSKSMQIEVENSIKAKLRKQFESINMTSLPDE